MVERNSRVIVIDRGIPQLCVRHLYDLTVNEIEMDKPRKHKSKACHMLGAPNLVFNHRSKENPSGIVRVNWSLEESCSSSECLTVILSTYTHLDAN